MFKCVNCGKFDDKQRTPTCSDQCTAEAIEFSFLYDRLGWSEALQYWIFCAEKRGEIINEV